MNLHHYNIMQYIPCHRHMCAMCTRQLHRCVWVLYVLGSLVCVWMLYVQLGVYGVTQKGAQSVPDTDSGHTSDYKADIVLVEHQY